MASNEQRRARDNAPALVITDYSGWRSLLNPLWCYHGFLTAVTALTGFGLIMVFSSSTVTMASQGRSPFLELLSQGMLCTIGLIVGFAARMMRIGFWRRTGLVWMYAAIGLQLLTFTPLGIDNYGNRGWLSLGFTTLQPAECMKMVLCFWMPSALVDSAKRYPREGIRAYARPMLVYAVGLALVVAGKDLGTAMILVIIGLVALFVSGLPTKWMIGIVGAMVTLVLLLAFTSPNRMRRIFAAYCDCSASDAQTVCYQSVHAKYAIASGGFLGVGIGNSREKWNYLPAAQNDFIFAVIGEETGFVGAAVVILFFVVIGWCLIATALQLRDRYVSRVLVCVTAWFVGQALINIGVVVGIFPVLGVPLPFVSAGGSSLVMCMATAGMTAGMLRRQPQIMQSRKRA